MKSIRIVLSAFAVLFALILMFTLGDSDDAVSAESDSSVPAIPAADAVSPENMRPGDPPAVGDEAPDIELESNEGNLVNLEDYRGKWAIVYFYPKDFTRGCTIQAQKFQKDLAEYEKRNAVILGISVDTAESHKEFCAKESLEFKLLADIGGHVSEAYGSLREGDSGLSARNTFVIDPDGVVAKVFLNVNPTPHSEEVLAALDELQAD